MNDQSPPDMKEGPSPPSDDGMDDSFVEVPSDELDWKLHDANVKAFEKHSSHFASKLKSVSNPQSKLVKNSQNEFDIEFRGTRLYGKSAVQYAMEQTSDITKSTGVHQLLINPPDSTNLDDESNVSGYRIVRRASESGINFLTRPSDPRCFHLVVFGIGLGFHLPALAEKTECRHLICVEPTIEFAYHSLFVFDWAGFLDEMEAEKRHLCFVDPPSATQISEDVRDNVRFINPAFVDGILFFKSYFSSVMSSALDILLRDRDTIGTGLGFLEDEIDMVRNSYRNLANFNGRHYKARERMIHIPVFIIGGGPSLDNDLEFIRKSQDRAIIISCGTALRILLKNRITPDFQVEMENVPAVTHLMEILSKEHDLGTINLVASSTVDPGVSPYFRETIYYFRASLASFPLFNQGMDTMLTYATPTVSNLGVSFAQSIGCRTFYFFGIDLGARDAAKHHADDAPYNHGEVEFNTLIDVPHAGNFGGTVLTEMVYQWARQTIELAISYKSSGRKYYNCSDGCRIDLAIPVLSSSIELPEAPDKQQVLQDLVQSFPEYTPQMFETSWNKKDLRKCLDDYAEELISIVNKHNDRLEESASSDVIPDPNVSDGEIPTDKKLPARTGKQNRIYDLQFCMDICRVLIPPTGDSTTEGHYFRGSTLMLFALVNYYYNRVPNEDQRRLYVQIVTEEFVYQIRRTVKRVRDFYDMLEGKEPADDTVEPVAPGNPAINADLD